MDRDVMILKWLAFGIVMILLGLWLWSSLELKTYKIQDVTVTYGNRPVTCYKKTTVKVPKTACFGRFSSISIQDEVKYVPVHDHTSCETNIEEVIVSRLRWRK